MQNYLWNMLINIQNGQIAKLNFILHPRKVPCEAVLQILWKNGYILGYQVDKNNYKKFKIFLKYKHNKSVINSIKKLSNTGHNIFYSIYGT
jgi:ribosomal protein S8